MASWEPDAELTHPVDFRLVHNSFVTMFWSRERLAATLSWLHRAGYDVVRLDASAWHSPDDMMVEVGRKLSFPNYFGRNLDALNDCMRDVASGDYGVRPDATGLVLVLDRFDAFAARFGREGQALLNIFAVQARNAALIGNRIICLVQTDDAQLNLEAVGATPVGWNDAEVARHHRGGDRGTNA